MLTYWVKTQIFLKNYRLPLAANKDVDLEVKLGD
jgi:hypothetical protein